MTIKLVERLRDDYLMLTGRRLRAVVLTSMQHASLARDCNHSQLYPGGSLTEVTMVAGVQIFVLGRDVLVCPWEPNHAT